MNEAHKEAAPTEPQESAASQALGVEPAGVDPYQAGREAAEEAIALVRGLEERVASLQDRLEEAIDSREGIERQMAAQNEELRVQRAAIARTQRAVRNISRPEGENRPEPGSPAAD
jgi:TolA-binding protein